jgi:hypothetical protein
VSTASVATFIEQINSGKLSTDKATVYKFIKEHPRSTINKVRNFTNLTKIVVGARLSELRALGVVTVLDTVTLSDGTFSRYVVEEDKLKIALNAKAVRKERFIKWLKKGNEFKDLLDPTTNEVIDYILEKEYHNKDFIT